VHRIKIGESVDDSVDRMIQLEDAIYAGFNSALHQRFKSNDPKDPAARRNGGESWLGGSSNNYVMRTDPTTAITTVGEPQSVGQRIRRRDHQKAEIPASAVVWTTTWAW